MDLLGRGFTRDEIHRRGYGSLRQAGRTRLASQCHNGCPERLVGVPGFYIAGENARDGKVWSIAGRVGLLIPCRDPRGRIRGCRIRPDDPGEDGGKYRWLSSGHKPGGTGSGTHCHVARPLSGATRDPAIWITEGEIKADVASERLGAAVLSIPGVDLWPRALADLVELLPDGGAVVVALDADWRDKRPVHAAVWGLALACEALGYATEVALWDLSHKGLDDLLTAGRCPQKTARAEVPEPQWTLKESSRIVAEASAGTEPACMTLARMREALAGILDRLCPYT
jgi:hypothetical protein